MQHIYGNNCTYFITFRLPDSLPLSKFLVLKMNMQKLIDSINEKVNVKKQLLIDEIAMKISEKYYKQLNDNPYGS